MNNFDGQKIKSKLKEIGATMADLSRSSGVPYNSINHYLQGYRKPGKKNDYLIHAALSAMEDGVLKAGLQAMKVVQP